MLVIPSVPPMTPSRPELLESGRARRRAGHADEGCPAGLVCAFESVARDADLLGPIAPSAFVQAHFASAASIAGPASSQPGSLPQSGGRSRPTPANGQTPRFQAQQSIPHDRSPGLDAALVEGLDEVLDSLAEPNAMAGITGPLQHVRT